MEPRALRQKTDRAPETAAVVAIEVTAGELIDRLTILTLKTRRVHDAAKRLMAARELSMLRRAAGSLCDAGASGPIVGLTSRLEEVNGALWDVEDALRAMERDRDFGPAFIAAARSVYRLNDERARLKNEVNAAAGCALREVKEHPEY
jgi:hypothetical protein